MLPHNTDNYQLPETVSLTKKYPIIPLEGNSPHLHPWWFNSALICHTWISGGSVGTVVPIV
jgi:hypothetical protein